MTEKQLRKIYSDASAFGGTVDRMLSGATDERHRVDALADLKIGAKEVVMKLIDLVESNRGVHVETLLACIGSLGGFACHMAVREAVVDAGRLPEGKAFTVVPAKDGNVYYFGRLVNKPLAEDRLSFWSLVAGATQRFDRRRPPNIESIVKRVASSVGTRSFGIPVVPSAHKPGAHPLELVSVLWPEMLPLIDRHCRNAAERPVLLGLAAQEALAMSKDVIRANLAARLLMECAVPMSKIGPGWLRNPSAAA